MKNSKKIILISTLILLIFPAILFCFQDSTATSESTTKEPESNESKFKFHFSPSLGLTFLSNDNSNELKESMQWLSKVDSKLSYDSDFFQFASSLFIQYGQLVQTNKPPQKMQDVFILSLMPSITIIKSPSIRLFLETTAETNLGKGEIDNRPTSFADPMFLYQTLFVGQKQYLIESTEKSNFEITYGLGYAFQQTFTKNFKLDTLKSGNSQTAIESGISAVFQVDLKTQIIDNLIYKLDLKSIALSKDNSFRDLRSSRVSLLLISGISYSFIGIEYNLHLTYDKNISKRRELEQSLMLNFALDL